MRLALNLTVVFVVSILAAFYYWGYYTPRELAFSDGAHYAVIARHFYETNAWMDRFSFFGPSIYYKLQSGNLFPTSVLPLTPLSIWASFKIFGVNDFIAVTPSIIFFSLSSVLVYFLLNRQWGSVIAWLGSLAFILFKPFLDYSTSAATEPLFIFLLLAAFACLSTSNKYTRLLSFPFILATLYTRPHAPFYLPAFLIVFLQGLNAKQRKIFILISIAAVTISSPFWLKLPYFDTRVQSQIFFASSSLMPANTALRTGGSAFDFSIIENIKVLLVKIFYNSYNLLKLLPQILPPFLIPFVAMSVFIKKIPRSQLVFFGIAGLINLLAVTASVPSFRYLHPLIPFAILLGLGAFSEITKKMELNRYKVTVLGILLFVLIPASSLLLDARYVVDTHHFGRPSSAKVLGQKLGELTPSDSVVVTNLDVWGTWFGNRTTIWFPLVPDQIGQVAQKEGNPIDYIYITSYKARDENLFVGEEWQSLLNDPPTITNKFLKENYTIVETITIPPEDNYENIALKAVLLKRI